VAERTEDAILFEEIDDELRQDQANKLWRAYGKYLITLCIAIVLSVGGYKAWTHHDLTARQGAGERFAAAITLAADDKKEDAFKALDNITTDGPEGYKVLASFSQARLMVQKNDTAGAAIAYQNLAKDTSLDILYRDLAVILGALVELNLPDTDLATLKQKLKKLSVKDNPWQFSAREISAIIEEKTGAKIEASKLLKGLKNDALTPKGIRARAMEMLSIMDN
jgi:hypothetical protein